MKAYKLKEDIYAVGAKDWDLREFHGYKTPRGTTYNSYLVMDEKITLIDGVKEYTSDEQIERIKSVTDFSKITYLVANHIENDHSGSIPKLMKLAPQMKIITNTAGKMALEAHFDTTGWQYEIVKTGDVINIGKRNLTFMTTPMLHWPDSMMTYIPEEKILFSNDGFGQHYSSSGLYAREQNMGIVLEEAKKYYANILFPFGTQADKALHQAHDLGLDIEMIAPSHGCIWQGKEEVGQILKLYSEWADNVVKEKAVVVYDSMWGATAKLAEEVMAEFQDQGFLTVKHNLAVTDYSDVIIDILDAKYVAIGNPTMNNQIFPKVAMFMTVLKGLQPKNKKALAFGSYGWKPGVVNQLQEIFEELNWTTVSPFEEKYTPKTTDVEVLREKVRELIKK